MNKQTKARQQAKSKQSSQPCMECNYTNNYYGDQLCKDSRKH